MESGSKPLFKSKKVGTRNTELHNIIIVGHSVSPDSITQGSLELIHFDTK